MRTYYWDFFGPHAQRTAEHFRKHLDEFLAKNACPGQTDVGSDGASHAAVSCRVSVDWFEPIERALRPKRHRDD